MLQYMQRAPIGIRSAWLAIRVLSFRHHVFELSLQLLSGCCALLDGNHSRLASSEHVETILHSYFMHYVPSS
jgi:hypothetical protein